MSQIGKDFCQLFFDGMTDDTSRLTVRHTSDSHSAAAAASGYM